jgi:RNA polymerase sigma-70 factor (ECF subfamily)
MALRLSGRRSDAEDLTAETYLRAYRSLCTFDQERIDSLQPRAWLSTILVNEWRNFCRNASRRPVWVGNGTEGTADPVDPDAGVEEQAEQDDDARRLARSLAALPERQRIAVVLRYIVDLPLSEIAEVLHCPVNTAKSHLRRGMDRLRSTHDRDGGADTEGPPATDRRHDTVRGGVR